MTKDRFDEYLENFGFDDREEYLELVNRLRDEKGKDIYLRWHEDDKTKEGLLELLK